MARPNSDGGRRPPSLGLVIAARAFLIVLGCAGVVWGIALLPGFWRDATLHRLAAQIIAGQRFKPEALLQERASLEAVERTERCRPATLRSAAVIQLRIVEDAMDAGERRLLDESLASMRSLVRQSLACSPTDSFLWLVLFWIENATQGYRTEHLDYLRMSYRLGPSEGWVALKRNPQALALYEQLPPDIAEMALTEFTRLAGAGLHSEVATILTGPGWHIRDVLLTRLNDVGRLHRLALAKIVHDRGYDIAVPGIQLPVRHH